MRLTEVADRPPRQCAVSARDDGPFVDFQVQIDPPTHTPTNLFIHALIVEEAGKLVGMVPAREVEEIRAELREVTDEMDAIRDVLTAAGDLEEAMQTLKERTNGKSIVDVLSDLKERIG